MATTRLLLVRHATTTQTRRAAFPATSGAREQPGCLGLDRGGRAQALRLAGLLPAPDRCWSSLAARAIETAELLGCPSPVRDPDLAECDFGAWAGRDPEAVYADDPDGIAAWHADPDAAPHGGEGLAAVRARARRVLDRAAAAGGTIWAVSHGGLIKAALLEVLGLPSAGVWRLDAAPASVAELHHTSGTWRVTRLNWTPVPAGWPGAPAEGWAGARVDGRPDARVDGRPDARVDGRPDARVDGQPDGSVDGGQDAPVDGAERAPRDGDIVGIRGAWERPPRVHG